MTYLRILPFMAAAIAAVSLASCSIQHTLSDGEKLERALTAAGDNRREFEKVLDRYASDPERSEAARWLISNMPMHFTSTGEETERYRSYFRIAADHSLNIKALVDSLDSVHGRPNQGLMQRIPDITTLDSAFLAAHIDAAFRERESRPWGKNVRWEDFLEFVLPYRIGDEPATLWRDTIMARYGTLIDSVAALPGSDNPLFAADQLYRAWMGQKTFRWTSKLPVGPRLGVEIADWKTGACRERADGMTYLLRAAGLPASLHLAPVRGDLNDSHSWGVIYDRNGYPYIPEQHSDSASLFKVPAAKVQCETFSINEEVLGTFTHDPDAPSALRNPFMKDMTASYLPPAAMKPFRLPLDMLGGTEKGDTVYIASASHREWVPVGYGVAGGDSVDFGYVGKDVVCVAGRWKDGALIPVSYPFRYTSGGETVYYTAGEMVPVNLYSKCSVTVGDFAQRMVGGVFETSATPDFASEDTIHVIQECPKRLYTEVRIDSMQPRRYVRYRGADKTYCNVAEIALFENAEDTVRMTGRIIGTPGSYDEAHEYTSAWDGDPYTSMDHKERSGAWTGMDLGHPRKISRIVYTPRNRDNFIHSGYTYELFYFDRNRGWISLGRAKADSDVIRLEAPAGALLYLHCLDGGQAERIFEYDPASDIQLFR